MNKTNLGIYIHIPFCARKCLYCDFLSFQTQEEVINQYIKALTEEISNFPHKDRYQVKTIFFGGGTPSIIKETHITGIMHLISSSFPLDATAEITIETNPGTLTKEKLHRYRKAGINRLSMGLQSTSNQELKRLGRIHTYEDFIISYNLAREAGFHNINIDLMSALPRQSLESWEETLHKIIKISPEHISAYGLIIEEGTAFYDLYAREDKMREQGEDPYNLPSEETERAMYYQTFEILKNAGYDRYEISNYARPGYECKHNISYWERTDYIGFGLGSASLINNDRFHNTKNLDEYLSGNVAKEETQSLSLQEQMEEFLFLGLRMTKGVSLQRFKDLFGCTLYSRYKATIDKLICQQLIAISKEHLKLTEQGIDISNYVLSQFL